MKRMFLSMAVAGLVAMGATAQASAAPPKSVLMVLWRGPTESESAYKARLAELGIDVAYTEIDGEQDRGKLAGKIREIDADIGAKKFDVIYSYGTTVTQVVTGVVRNRAPVVFNIVYDAVGGKLVPDAKDPGIPVSGITNGVPLAKQFEALSVLGPIKKLAVFFNAREANSAIIEKQVSEWAAANGVQVTSFRVSPGNDSAETQAKQAASGDFDTVYLPADTFLASVADKIIPILSGKRVYGGTQTFVLRGALAAYTPKVEDMGRAAADMSARILKGEDPNHIAVALPQPILFVSGTAAQALGIAPPGGSTVER